MNCEDPAVLRNHEVVDRLVWVFVVRICDIGCFDLMRHGNITVFLLELLLAVLRLGT